MLLENGYETKTTFWQDFTTADKFGVKEIKDTYKNAFSDWKNNYVYLTELVLILNWKLWQHWENGNEEIARVYDELWRMTDTYACENLKDDKLDYYLRTTD